MHGYQSTENVTVRANRYLAGEFLGRVFATVVVGVIAGLLMAHVRLRLGFPGHKVIFWMIPVIVARVAFRLPAGATLGAFAASLTCLGFGGSFAGGLANLPLIGVAGMILDGAIGLAQRRALPAVSFVAVVSVAAMFASLICFGKHLIPPASIKPHLLWGLTSTWGIPLSYAMFGVVAGLIGSVAATGITRPQGRTK